MNDLDSVLANVEQVSLSPDTQQRHLAELMRAQSVGADLPGRTTPAGGSDRLSTSAPGMSGPRTRSLIAAGLAAAAVVTVAGGAWLLVAPAAPQQDIPVGGPTSVSSIADQDPTRTGTPVGKDTDAEKKAQASKDADAAKKAQARKDSAGAAASKAAGRQDLLTTPAAVQMLASNLGVSRDKAAAAGQRLIQLAGSGSGVDPSSSGFAAVARSLGVAPGRLEQALTQVKLAFVDRLGTGKATPAGAEKAAASRAASGSNGKPTEKSPLTSPSGIRTLASILQVSQGKARTAMTQVLELAENNNGIDPRSTEFAAIARTLGVTAAKLHAALVQVKMSA